MTIIIILLLVTIIVLQVAGRHMCTSRVLNCACAAQGVRMRTAGIGYVLVIEGTKTHGIHWHVQEQVVLELRILL